MRQALDVYRTGGLQDIVTITGVPENTAHMDEIRIQVVIMTGEQRELLAARSAAFYRQYQRAVLLGLGINAAAIAVIVLFYRSIRRSFNLRLAAERALQQMNDQLESTIALRTEQLSVLSRHLIRVAEEEKARLARELHDEMGANLTAIGIDLSAVGEQLRASHPELAAMLARARKTLVDTVQFKQRIIENLRPSLLDNLGLAAALHSYCGDYSRVTGIDCEVLVEGEVDRAAPMQAIALFRITQEALNNVAKYAGAGRVAVRRRHRHRARRTGAPAFARPAGYAGTGLAAGRKPDGRARGERGGYVRERLGAAGGAGRRWPGRGAGAGDRRGARGTAG
jgi:signal transduction histidine kinase